MEELIKERLAAIKINELSLSIRGYLTEGKTAEITGLWMLNQDFSRTLLFGQYMAQIFNEINKIK